MASGNEPGRDTRGVAELVAEASDELSRLVRAELRLAMAELKEKAVHAGAGAMLCAAAAATAAYGMAALLVAVIAAIALPVWAAALIVGVVLLAGAGIAGLLGGRQLARGVPPVPGEAAESVKRDIAEIRERAHR